jgi:Ni/Co efflux regulator RcnB
MSKIFSSMLAVGLLASLPTPATAQRHDQRRPQASHGQVRQNWREVSMSRGHHWRQGQRLAANQRRYVVNDWQARGLRTPPRGYRWVRENNNSGDYLLIAAATGLIASILSQ